MLVLSLALTFAGSPRSFQLFARGPDFPNSLLDQGDAAVLVAPVANFTAELERMKLVASKFKAVPAPEHLDGKDDFAAQASDAEMADLAVALSRAKIPDEESERMQTAHAAVRHKLDKFMADTAT